MSLHLQTNSFQSASRFFCACCGVFLVGGFTLIALELSLQTAGSESLISTKITRKGDRLPMTQFLRKSEEPAAQVRVPHPPTPKFKMAVGCEPLVSSLGYSPLKHVAGRCLS